MKTRKHLFALLFVMIPLFAFSQEGGLKLNKFWDNWFISVGGGGQMVMAEEFDFLVPGQEKKQSKDLFNMDYWSPAVNLSIGKWFTPVVALRAQGYGWEVKNRDWFGDKKFQYWGVHADAMINLNNLFAKYNPNRFFTITPWVGVGFVHRMKIDDVEGPGTTAAKDDMLSANAGFLFGFRLSRAVDLNLEIQGSILPDQFNGRTVLQSYEGVAAATLGLTYKFKKRDFEPCAALDDSEIQRLLAENNRLQSDLEICLKKTVPPCPPCPKPETTTIVKGGDCPPAAFGVVRFALNSIVITTDQQLNVYNAAEYLKNNPGVNVQVVGYADVKTGNPTINLKLSEQRAKAVAKMMVDKYGIPENRIETSWNGDTVQPYSTNEWNRVVIFVPQK